MLPLIGWADALDVIVVAIMLFGVISWARRSTARNMVAALLAFGILYLISRELDMYLTRVFLEAILAVAVLTGVIVFQDDIRRFLDAMGAWPFGGARRRSMPNTPAWIDVLVSASAALADARTGALIAIAGAESWSRSVRGGIRLDGELSASLLMSIFDHHSAGHDGAILVEGSRIARFAAHLPLSSNHDLVGARGTRHAAAVGLSEACDALVIVVSEEAGTIRVAERGVLSTVNSAAELHGRLEQFRDRLETRRSKPWRSLWTHHSMQNGAVAVIGSLCLWLFFAHQTDVIYRVLPVPIELRLNEGVKLVHCSDTETRVTLHGTALAFELLNEKDLVAVVDLSDLAAGTHVIEIAQDQITLPDAISFSELVPRFIRVSTQGQIHEPGTIED